MRLYLRSFKRLAEFFLLIASAGYIISFFYVAFSRMSYPYDLEWLEGGLACGVQRLIEGKPLYAAPSSEYFSFAYTPLYYYLVWGFSVLFGLNLWVGRLVSILASICIGLLLARMVYRQTGSGFLSLVVPGLYFASFHYTGSFFDLFRVDSAAYAFALGGFYVCWFWPSGRGEILGAILLCAAVFTKQTVMLFMPIGMIFMLSKGRRPALTFIIVCIIIILFGIARLNVASQGWFYKICMRQSSGVGFKFEAGARHVLREFLFSTPLIFLSVAFWIIRSFFAVRHGGSKNGYCWWILPFAAGMLAFLFAQSGYSGWSNDSIPMVIFGFLFAGFFWGDARRDDEAGNGLLDWLLLMAAGFQFILFMYSPLKEIPSMADRQAGVRLMRELKSFDGQMLAIYHPFYPVLLGKRPSFHADELFFYYIQGGKDPEKAELPKDLIDKIQNRYYAAIVLDQERGLARQQTGTDLVEIPKLKRLIDENYRLDKRLFEKDDPAFWPRTGWGTRPDFLYLPREGNR